MDRKCQKPFYEGRQYSKMNISLFGQLHDCVMFNQNLINLTFLKVSLSYRYGCGNSVHIKCMKIWAEHQKSSGETIIKCPLCRVDFGSFEVTKMLEWFTHTQSTVARCFNYSLQLLILCLFESIRNITKFAYLKFVAMYTKLTTKRFSVTYLPTDIWAIGQNV